MGEARFLKSGIVIPSLALLVVQVPLGKAVEPNSGFGRG